MSISLKEATENFVDKTTGEVLCSREYREIKINNSTEPPFVKSYRGKEGGDIRKIKNVPIGFWVTKMGKRHGAESEACHYTGSVRILRRFAFELYRRTSRGV